MVRRDTDPLAFNACLRNNNNTPFVAHYAPSWYHPPSSTSPHGVAMKISLAQFASKVWEAIKPPKPELGYFMPDEQSNAIRSWRTKVASSILLDPNELDALDQRKERDSFQESETWESMTATSAREVAAERAAERAAAEKTKARAVKGTRKR
ncbi:unnamed protein product [Cutaneotrichosporon oleaginosum]